MPRRKEEEAQEDSHKQPMHSTHYQAGAGALHANAMREEELIALLREQQYRQQQAVALAAALPTSLAAAYLAPREGRPFATAPPVSAASFLPTGQPQPLTGLSATTILELARTRPDLLAMLQQPPLLVPHPPPRPNVLVLHPQYPPTLELPPGKRSRSGEQEETSSTEKLDKENESDEKEDQNEQECEPRPRKRVAFQTADRASQPEQGQGSETASNQEESKPDKDSWTADHHRSFVEAVFTMGIKHASPSVLLDLMANVHEFPLTSERVKSRLQKYRNHGDKSKSDFMQEYDTFLQRALSIGRQPSAKRLLPPPTLLQIMGQELPLYGGEAAALSTYEMLYRSRCQTQSGGPPGGQEGEFDATVHRFLTPDLLKRGSETLLEHCHGQTLEIPQLTAEEKASPLGSCLEHIMGTFQALTKQLERQRDQTNKKSSSSANKGGNSLPAANDGPLSSNPLAPPQAPPKASGEVTLVGVGAAPSAGTMKAIENTGPKTTALKTPPEHATTPTKAPLEVRPEDKPDEKDPIEKLVALMYQHKKGNMTVL